MQLWRRSLTRHMCSTHMSVERCETTQVCVRAGRTYVAQAAWHLHCTLNACSQVLLCHCMLLRRRILLGLAYVAFPPMMRFLAAHLPSRSCPGSPAAAPWTAAAHMRRVTAVGTRSSIVVVTWHLQVPRVRVLGDS
jgi:hypothetical protein